MFRQVLVIPLNWTPFFFSSLFRMFNHISGRVCASNCYLEAHQQGIGEILANVKVTVHLKDEYENNVDFISIFSEQRHKQHEMFCSLQKDGGFVDSFFAYARFGNFRNVALEMQPSFPFVTLKHKVPSFEDSSLSIFFAVSSGDHFIVLSKI